MVPTSATWVQRIRCHRDGGGRPPKIRVASTAPLSSDVTTAVCVPSGRSAAVDAVQLQVVDGAHGDAVDVEDLPVEQVQAGVEHEAAGCSSGGRAHDPAPVAIIRGIAATDAVTMITRYTSARRW